MPDSQRIFVELLPNGLTLIVEEIGDVQSLAYELLIPGGIICDDPAFLGSSLLLAELSARGAGELESRDLSEAFDRRGIRHAECAGHDRFVYRGALTGEHFDEALKLTALMVREPKLPEAEVAAIQSLALQDIAALKDNPARRAMVELAAHHYPEPYNRPACGSEEGIHACSPRQLRLDWQKRYGARGGVLSVAGRCSTAQVLKLVKRHFSSWQGQAAELPAFGSLPPARRHHIDCETAQVQICLAYPSAPYGTQHYYAAKVALSILSGGMFGRLFVEVREKRGLCYSVQARHHATKDYGTVTAYAGTTPERAAEAFRILVDQLEIDSGSIDSQELARAKANLKSALVIGEEAPAARASSNAQDWWLEKRVRTMEEVMAAVDKVGAGDVEAYQSAYPVKAFTSLTLGPKEVQT